MQFIADNKKDFLFYFSRSYVGKIEQDGKVTSFYIRGESSVTRDAVLLQDVLTGNVIEEHWQKVLDEFLLHPQMLGMTSVNETVFYISRVPVRHARKGFGDHGNLISYSPHDTLLRELGAYPTISTLAQAVYNNKYTTISETLEGIHKGNFIGRAIGRYFGVYAPDAYEGVCLLYKNINIGTVDDKGQVILAEPYSSYKEALTQYCGADVLIKR